MPTLRCANILNDSDPLDRLCYQKMTFILYAVQSLQPFPKKYNGIAAIIQAKNKAAIVPKT